LSVIFESTIKMVEGSKTDWYIELKDTIDGTIEICKDLQEYSKKIEELGNKYGGIIDEVKWNKNEDIHPIIINEIRFKMAQLQKEIEEERGEPIIKEENS